MPEILPVSRRVSSIEIDPHSDQTYQIVRTESDENVTVYEWKQDA
jgi:hypothetical protein